MPEISAFQSWLADQPPGTTSDLVDTGVASWPVVAKLARDPSARVSPLVALRIHKATAGAVPYASLVNVPGPARR